MNSNGNGTSHGAFRSWLAQLGPPGIIVFLFMLVGMLVFAVGMSYVCYLAWDAVL